MGVPCQTRAARSIEQRILPLSPPAPSSSSSTLSAPLVEHGAGAFTVLKTGVSFVRTERKDAAGRNTAWLVVRIDLGAVVPTVRAPPHNRLERLADDPGVAFAVNGGFFELSGAPTGLLSSRGQRVGVWGPHAGSGILLVSNGRARLVSSDKMPVLEGVELAVQCGPRLIEPGGAVGIHHDDGKRAARTAACIRDEGRELDVVLAWTRNSDRDGPGLLELARWLAAPIALGDRSGCESALNLDGGPSTGVYFRGFPDELRKPFGPVPWALVIAESSARD